MSIRIGLGFDSHAFKAGIPLVIGGLKIDHPEGLAGHSDGDLLLHAITDALLGAVAAGDIGTFFPPSDPKWKGADSTVFLKTALEEVALAGYKIVNIDCVLVMHRPKIVPIAGELRERVAELLQLDMKNVSIKDIKRGMVAGDSKNDPPLGTETFDAQVIVMDHPNKIMEGYTPVLDCHTAHSTILSSRAFPVFSSY